MNDALAYKVLARKYRPETFADLVGQDAMVRTLRNAFAADRIAQAFVMTGIRGTGKTTTARIIAKGMNCIGVDGTSGPTTDPCGTCEHCTAIMDGRHVDVLEMDAASRTGVGDIREIIESVQYRAASARYKIYIIDEVHMLSTSAFNALLKTLEEPPAHVKFIFATTEIRKVPVTVLSRCQRFDLRRIEPEDMIVMLRRIAEGESAKIADDALALITRAAEGSARDATSLLDQAISHGAGETTANQVRAMLGLADRGRVLDLFEAIMRGDAGGALTELGEQYADGADPLAVLRDLAEITHWISVVKITPSAAEDPTINPDERTRGQDLAQRLGMRPLTRMWQMLLKALDEVASAPNAMMAAEMAIIRLTHVAELPSPEDLIRRLQDSPMPPAVQQGGTFDSPPPASSSSARQQPMSSGFSSHGHAVQAIAAKDEVSQSLARYPTFHHVLELINNNRDKVLQIDVEKFLRLAAYQPGRIEFTPTDNAPTDLAQRLGSALQRWTGNRWGVSIIMGSDAPTIEESRNAAIQSLHSTAASHELVKTVLSLFPKAEITRVRSKAEIAAEVQTEALPEVDDEWDPFEEG
jgi:DNA polymerase III subunit gamma/tau